jgi:protein SCO1/2
MKRYVPYLLIPFAVLIILALMFAPMMLDGGGMKRITTDKAVKTGIVAGYEDDILLLFFGYAGCVDVCSPRLEDIAGIYKSVNNPPSIAGAFHQPHTDDRCRDFRCLRQTFS